jgi:hypothetical protein
MKFAIFDAANLFMRAHHVCSGDAFTKAGMALHIVFNSLRKVHREYETDHIVIVGEGRSWRYDHYPQYKAKRILARKLLTPKEQEENEVYREVIADLMEFFATKTRMTVLQTAGCEGDDLVARFIQLHDQDEHIIISADSDHVQLLAPNVKIYDGITDRTISLDGVFDAKGQPMVFNVDPASGKLKVKGTVEDERKKHRNAVKDDLRAAKATEKAAKASYDEAVKKSGKDSAHAELLAKSLTSAKLEVLKVENKLNESFEWEMEEDFHRKALFLKIIRGDVGDGIFSANPGVRYKGSKKSVGIEDAWNDRKEKGFHWNNFMLKRWEKLIESPDGDRKEEVRVLDEYHRNEQLIDLTKQPEHIIELMDRVIVDAVQKEPVQNVGIHFARFCAKHDLKRMGQDAPDHARYLGAPYSKD